MQLLKLEENKAFTYLSKYGSVLKNFAVFTGKHLNWSTFLKMLQVSWPVTLLKGDSNTGVFL